MEDGRAESIGGRNIDEEEARERGRHWLSLRLFPSNIMQGEVILQTISIFAGEVIRSGKGRHQARNL